MPLPLPCNRVRDIILNVSAEVHVDLISVLHQVAGHCLHGLKAIRLPKMFVDLAYSKWTGHTHIQVLNKHTACVSLAAISSPLTSESFWVTEQLVYIMQYSSHNISNGLHVAACWMSMFCHGYQGISAPCKYTSAWHRKRHDRSSLCHYDQWLHPDRMHELVKSTSHADELWKIIVICKCYWLFQDVYADEHII